MSGLFISSGSYQGLFGYVNTGGVIKNLTVSGEVSGGGSIGGVAGFSKGTIENCVSNCETVSGGGQGTGGVVGRNNGGTVRNCISNCTTVSGYYSTGGVVGENSGVVTNCVSNCGTVSGSYSLGCVGGVVGYGNGGTVSNCVNTGAVTATGGSTKVGGVVGHLYGGAVTDCWWYKPAGGTDYPAKGIGNGDTTGVTSADTLTAFPVTSITLDSYYFEGGSFDITATAYPLSSGQATGGLKLTPTTIALAPATLANGVKTTVTATGGTAGASYNVTVTLATTPPASNDLHASAQFTVKRTATPTPPVPPTPVTKVIIVSTDTTVNDYVVSEDWTVEVTGATLTVNGEVTNEGTVKVKDGGKVIFGTDSAVTGDGSIVLEDGGKVTNNSKNDITITAGGKPVIVKPGETYPPAQHNSSGGACAAGFGALALLAFVPVALRKKRR